MNDEIEKAFVEQGAWLERRLNALMTSLATRLDEANRLQAASEERCRVADERTERREEDNDLRIADAVLRAERQTRAWEVIAAALNRIADRG